MAETTALYVTTGASLLINVLMFLDKILSRVKKSECCGNRVEMTSSSSSGQRTPDLKDSNSKIK
jgi:hypothetical protein